MKAESWRKTKAALTTKMVKKVRFAATASQLMCPAFSNMYLVMRFRLWSCPVYLSEHDPVHGLFFRLDIRT